MDHRFISEALIAHNECRRKHGSPDLVHNPELSKIAQKWADNIASRSSMKHSKNKYNEDELGENIAMFFETGAKRYDGRKATMQWYEEIKDYNFIKSEFKSGTGHFTQVVWKNSKQVGFGVAQASDGSFYAVANYFPAGNWSGEFKENVLPPLLQTDDSSRSKSQYENLPRFNDDNDGGRNSRLKKFNIEQPKPTYENSSYLRSNENMQSKFVAEALAAHNECRRKHGVPDLVHNPELSKIAQSWADQISARNSMQHSKNVYNGDKLGENIAMFYETGAKHYDGKKATMQWYDEIKDYNFNKSVYIPGTGHFTQVVWKDSKQVGFGVAQGSDGSFYAVANYYPPGNYISEFKANVLPIVSDSRLNRNNIEPTRAKPPEVANYENLSNIITTKYDSDKAQRKFVIEALAAHNECRSKHGVPDLVHNPELSKIAQSWANNLASIKSLEHSKNLYDNKKLGENVAMWFKTGATKFDGFDATIQWYNEIDNYNFEKSGFSPGTGHFTQVVWKETQQVGFGVAQASDGSFFAVANYYPAGNMLGRFKNNVPALLSNRPLTSHAPKTEINSGNNRDSFIDQALKAHNEYRRKHSVAPLSHNPELSKIAQQWAERIALRNKMEPSGNKYKDAHLGENISMWGSTNATHYDGKHATDQWYDTIKYHNFLSNDFDDKTGSFTQIVWKDSKEVGFGVARASNGYFYAVANYYPSGNYSGKFRQNVFKS